MKRTMFLTMLLLLVGVNTQAQSVSTEQMDERFNNNNKLPYGWFAEGWKVDSTGVAKKGSPDKGQSETGSGTPGFNMEDLMGGGSSLNQSSDFQLSCRQMTKAEVMKFCVTEKDKQYIIEPALKDLNSDKFIPISEIVDAQTMENFNKPFSMSFTPGGNAAGSALNVYSALIKMMPLND